MLLCLSRGYAGARAEKFSTDSIFLSLSRAVCCREGREIACRQQISLPKPGDMLVRGQRNCLQTAYFSVQAGRYAGAWAEKLPTDSRFLCLSREVCWCEGREIACRQQISLPKPGSMLSRGQKVRNTCAVKSVRKRIYLTRKNTCGSLVT